MKVQDEFDAISKITESQIPKGYRQVTKGKVLLRHLVYNCEEEAFVPFVHGEKRRALGTYFCVIEKMNTERFAKEVKE